MKGEDFEFVASLLKEHSGLSLTRSKTELIAGRLAPLAARCGFPTIPALVQELKKGNEPLLRSVVEAMTTHDTSFFRDRAIFDALRHQILPAFLRARHMTRHLRIWSAAAATGQEPYSMAMLLDDMPLFAGWDIHILATDISAEAIGRAQAGLYSDAEIRRGLPMSMLARYFRREGDGWCLSDSIRGRVQFRVFNLLDSFPALGCFDIIFCRNVLMYFDQAVKTDILDRLADCLDADGCLVLGAAETMLGVGNNFVSIPKLRGFKMQASHRRDSRKSASA